MRISEDEYYISKIFIICRQIEKILRENGISDFSNPDLTVCLFNYDQVIERVYKDFTKSKGFWTAELEDKQLFDDAVEFFFYWASVIKATKYPFDLN